VVAAGVGDYEIACVLNQMIRAHSTLGEKGRACEEGFVSQELWALRGVFWEVA
jgi:hypothetical protein